MNAVATEFCTFDFTIQTRTCKTNPSTDDSMISHNVYGQTQLHTTRGDHQIAGGMKEPMTYMQE